MCTTYYMTSPDRFDIRYLPQKELLEFSKANNIHVTAHSPLGGAPVAVVASGIPGPLQDPKVGG